MTEVANMRLPLRFALVLGAMFGASLAAASPQDIEVHVECTVSGTKVSGEKSGKPFKETFKIVKKRHVSKDNSGKEQVWGISNTEYFSDGTKYEAKLVDASSEHAVVSMASVVGAGYSRKLLVFTHVLDLKALELERVVTSVPAGSDERTRATCKRIQ